MASIPLPALDVRPPQPQADPMQQYGRLLALRNEMQMQPYQLQAAQQQAQSGQLQLQQQQIALKNQQAMTAAYQKWDGKNYSDLAHLALQNGATGDAVMGLQQHALTLQKTYSDIAAQDAATGASKLKTMQADNDMVAGRIGSLMDLPDAQLAQGITSAAQDLAQQGLIDPQHAQMAAQIAQSGDPQKMRAALGVFQKNYMAQSQQMETALKTAQTGEASARANEANVNAKLAPQLAASRLAFQQAQLRLSQQRAGMEGQRLDLQKQQLGMSPNGEPSDLVQAIASGHVTPERLSYLLARNPGLIQGVLQVDPSFDASKAAAYPQVYKDFTSSKPNTAGGSLLAGSTALIHLRELKELNDKNPTESRIPGMAAHNAYENKVDTVAGELARFYGTDTVPGIENIKKTLNATLNRDAAILTQVQSMGDRLDNYEQTWRNAAPSKMYEAPMPGISEAAKQARAALDPSYAARQRQTPGGAASKTGSSPMTITLPSGKKITID